MESEKLAYQRNQNTAKDDSLMFRREKKREAQLDLMLAREAREGREAQAYEKYKRQAYLADEKAKQQYRDSHQCIVTKAFSSFWSSPLVSRLREDDLKEAMYYNHRHGSK